MYSEDGISTATVLHLPQSLIKKKLKMSRDNVAAATYRCSIDALIGLALLLFAEVLLVDKVLLEEMTFKEEFTTAVGRS
jgi:hypothetical protein